ncbi:sporulation protein YtfJ [Paenibacillus sophorae]|uniref:GerW family sporulation protein n=1 Tax=Paenibacillus sophorae TaxID=1333845 RepID=A0A1H8M6M3_9BACL|nr:GerW family sporulation protein [Paenibacillus sophorae]QWU17694.1 GerW family sporulation protein [Paenibacillus sophorae]SEO13004.1 sporulation protein YtfJ [Paenibacillus sophorae]
MSEHIHQLLETALHNLKGIINAESVIGEPIQTPDGTVVIPICRTNFGFVTGGSEYSSSASSVLPFGGGIGGGVSVTPVAFLIIGPSGVQTVSLESPKDIYSRILDLSPQLLDKLKNLLDR